MGQILPVFVQFTSYIIFLRWEIWSAECQGKRIWGILRPADLCPAPSSLSMLPSAPGRPSSPQSPAW